MSTKGGIGADADFGRGEGDPLGGPDAPGAGAPLPPDIRQALVEFKVSDRTYGVRSVRMNWVDPTGEAEELLIRLWQIWYDEALAVARRDGVTLDLT